MTADRIRPVILSGGSGTRLWPLSSAERPKQFLALTGQESMLQLTLRRVLDAPGFALPAIIGNGQHRAELREQLAEIGVEGVELILEPAGRNTAAAIALAALRAGNEELLLVMPSDHVIRDVACFRAGVAAAAPVAREGYLITFGIAPSAPETGYGYIRKGDELAPSVHQVARFVEKPDLRTAESYLAEGDYAWNAGIFLFGAGDYLAALGRHAPDVLAACEAAVGRGRSEGEFFLPDESEFLRSPSISVDYAVMEKEHRVAVVPLDIGWSDIGSWDALYDYLAEGDGSGLASSHAVQIDCSRTMVKSSGPRVAAIGLDDVVVVATGDAVLVMRRGEGQRVKEAAERAEKI